MLNRASTEGNKASSISAEVRRINGPTLPRWNLLLILPMPDRYVTTGLDIRRNPTPGWIKLLGLAIASVLPGQRLNPQNEGRYKLSELLA
jgi:hypothetical protein